MAKIDTSGWKEFLVGELFDVVKGTRLTKANMIPGDIRFIGSSAMNNGCTAMVGNTENMHPANTITVCYNGSVGETFYQDQPFLASDDVNVLYPKFDMTKEIALFIAPLIKSVSARYNYVDKWKQEEMIAGAIKLPVDLSGEPDWAYMDEYMSAVMRESEASLESLRQTDGEKHALDIAEWQEFVIGNLFEPLESGFVGEGRKIGTATTSPDKEHTIPLTAAKNDNNGIMYWGRPGDYITYSNVIAVIRDGAVSTGRVFAQKNETGTYSHSYFIRVKGHTVSFLTNLFLSRVLEAVIYPRYTRDDACIWERIVNDTILLPADTSGEPDWVYMDEYMRTVMELTKSDLLAMQSIS